MRFNRTFALCAIALPLALATTQTQARDITAVDFGGATGAAMQKDFYGPYAKASHNPVTSLSYNGTQAKIQSMVQSGDVIWDLVAVEAANIGRGCEEGNFERVDWASVVNARDMFPGVIRKCGIGNMFYSEGLGYDASKFKGKTAPSSWADYWDVKKFPGKRGMNRSAVINLEFALMADGVATKDVYTVLATKAGVARALAKLDEIRPYIVWWENGTQVVPMLASGDVAMSTVANPRINDARKAGAPMVYVWRQSGLTMDYWAIPTGSPKKAQVIAMVKQAMQPAAQAAFSGAINSGPVSQKALSDLPADVQAKLPNSPANIKDALYPNPDFWAAHGDELERAFLAWASK